VQKVARGRNVRKSMLTQRGQGDAGAAGAAPAPSVAPLDEEEEERGEEEEDDAEAEYKAATYVQKVARGRNVRKSMLTQRGSGDVGAAAAHAAPAFEEDDENVEDEDPDAEHKAATYVQKVARGRNVRKSLLTQRSPSDAASSAAPSIVPLEEDEEENAGEEGEEEDDVDAEYKAATYVQKVARGRNVRKSMVTQRASTESASAAISPSALAVLEGEDDEDGEDGPGGDEGEDPEAEHKAATYVQKVARGRNVRKSLLTQRPSNESAPLVPMHARVEETVAEQEEQEDGDEEAEHKAATYVQKVARGRNVRKSVLSQRNLTSSTPTVAADATIEENESEDEGFFLLLSGTRIEGNYRGLGTWYPGVVAAVHEDGSADLDYDDGEKELRVAAALVRPEPVAAPTAAASGAALVAGTLVEGNYRGLGRWYPGRIASVNADGSADLDYDDGEKETGLAASLIRLEVGPVISSVDTAPARRPLNPMLLNSLGGNPQNSLKRTARPEIKSSANAKEKHAEQVKLALEHRKSAWEGFCSDSEIRALKTDFQDVVMGPLLGRGKFAAVYSATHHKSQVAVKLAQFKGNDVNNWTPLTTPRGTIAPRLNPDEIALAAAVHAAQSAETPLDAQGQPLPPLACTIEFHREIRTLQHFAQQENIVRLVGYSSAPLAVMLELLPEGSLHANLHNEPWQVSLRRCGICFDCVFLWF